MVNNKLWEYCNFKEIGELTIKLKLKYYDMNFLKNGKSLL